MRPEPRLYWNPDGGKQVSSDTSSRWDFLTGTGPLFTLKTEIKNVVTALAKTHHCCIPHVGRGRGAR